MASSKNENTTFELELTEVRWPLNGVLSQILPFYQEVNLFFIYSRKKGILRTKIMPHMKKKKKESKVFLYQLIKLRLLLSGHWVMQMIIFNNLLAITLSLSASSGTAKISEMRNSKRFIYFCGQILYNIAWCCVQKDKDNMLVILWTHQNFCQCFLPPRKNIFAYTVSMLFQ